MFRARRSGLVSGCDELSSATAIGGGEIGPLCGKKVTMLYGASWLLLRLKDIYKLEVTNTMYSQN